MAEQSLSIFHEQLLTFLQKELRRKKSEEGWDEHFDSDVRRYGDAVSQALRGSASLPLQEIIDLHHYLFGERGPIHLEQKILDAFPESEMERLGFSPLRMYRGLPRVYQKNQPTRSKIKPHFTHLPSLKRTAAMRSICSLYAGKAVLSGARVVVLSYVFSDGLGDFYAALEVAKVLKRGFPQLRLHMIILRDRASQEKLPSTDDIELCVWDGSEEQMCLLCECDCVFCTPTRHSALEELKERVMSFRDSDSPPIWEFLGEYGFLESDWFHPCSSAHCMGLHFLEKGILLRPHESVSVLEWDDALLAEQLFGRPMLGSHEKTTSQSEIDRLATGDFQGVDAVLDEEFVSLRALTQEEICQYEKKHRTFLAYLFTRQGIFVYLHALLKSLEKDSKDIDICMPDARHLINYFEQRRQGGKGIFEANYGVQQLVLYVGTRCTVWNLEPTGKRLRIICPGRLSSADFRRLLSMSGDFVACRGNQSFSETVSWNKGFFYDARYHNRYFIKDLLALAENRIASHSSTLVILRSFAKLSEYELLPSVEEWVDETIIQRDEPADLLQLSETIGRCLQDPDAFIGFKKLNRILREEHSCNTFILQLVQRAICHRRHAFVVRAEEEALSRFTLGQWSFSMCVASVREALQRD